MTDTMRELLHVAQCQGVHHDIIYLVDNHLGEFPPKHHDLLKRMANTARNNIKRSAAAVGAMKRELDKEKENVSN